MQQAGVNGPLLVSVGRADQLAKFLELNPELAGAKALQSRLHRSHARYDREASGAS